MSKMAVQHIMITVFAIAVDDVDRQQEGCDVS